MEYEQEHGMNGGEPTSDMHYSPMDYDQPHDGSVEDDYDEQQDTVHGQFDTLHDDERPEDFSPQRSVSDTFDQELMSLPALRGMDHLDCLPDYPQQLGDVQYSDSMQYTADTGHYYQQQREGSPTNESSAFARLAAVYSDEYDYQDAPLDEASANQQYQQRGTRMDPPDGEPPSLSKHDEAVFAANGAMSESMSYDQPEYDDDHFSNHNHGRPGAYQDDRYYDNDIDDFQDVDDGGFHTNAGLEGFGHRDRSMSPKRRADSTPVSPRSETYSTASAAIRAQDDEQRNRRLAKDTLSPASTGDSGDPGFTLRTADSESNGTWASESDFTGDSSMWTDGSSMPPDRMSRRALILQMAKARMKKDTPDKHEEKKVDPLNDTADFDLTGDLD